MTEVYGLAAYWAKAVAHNGRTFAL